MPQDPNDRRAWSLFLQDLQALCEKHSVGFLGGQAHKRLPEYSRTRLGSIQSGSQGVQAVTYTLPQVAGGEVEVGAITADHPDAAMGNNAEPQPMGFAQPLSVGGEPGG